MLYILHHLFYKEKQRHNSHVTRTSFVIFLGFRTVFFVKLKAAYDAHCIERQITRDCLSSSGHPEKMAKLRPHNKISQISCQVRHHSHCNIFSVHYFLRNVEQKRFSDDKWNVAGRAWPQCQRSVTQKKSQLRSRAHSHDISSLLHSLPHPQSLWTLRDSTQPKASIAAHKPPNPISTMPFTSLYSACLKDRDLGISEFWF